MGFLVRPTSIRIRPYVPDDAAATWTVFHEAVHRTGVACYTPAQLAAWDPGTGEPADWNARRTAAWTVVAMLDGVLVGFSDLTGAGVLDMLYVHPAYGRRGIARALIDAVLDEADRRGLAEVHTRASRVARPVFERSGFVVDRENSDNLVRGHLVPNYSMHVVLR